MRKNNKKRIDPIGNWDEEAEQSWVGFWNLLLQEDRKQNPNLYKKNCHKEADGRQLLKKIKTKK